MKLMVPTINVEAMVKKELTFAGKTYKVGEFLPVAYGIALQLRALETVGVFQDEDYKHAEAAEALQIYGGDSWFPQPLQTVSRVSDYLSQIYPGLNAGKAS